MALLGAVGRGVPSMVMPVHVVEMVKQIEREDDIDPFDIAMVRPSWFAHAACAGADIETFFPSRGEDCRDARLICDGCPVREACLDFALTTGQAFGVWGGLTEHQRRRARQERRVSTAC